MWKWILRVYVNGPRDVRLDHAAVSDMVLLSRDSAFHIVAWGVTEGSNSLVG